MMQQYFMAAPAVLDPQAIQILRWHFQKGLTLVSMLIFGAVSLANLMNCLGSRVLTTISPDFCTALKAAAVEES